MTEQKADINAGYALFRLPYAQEQILIRGSVATVMSCAELGHCQGFVVAPFAVSPKQPILVIQADCVNRSADGTWAEPMLPLPFMQGVTTQISEQTCHLRDDYHIDFLNFHTHLENGDFQKLVLSRSLLISHDNAASPYVLFQRACAQYPRMFISLVYTEQSGLWLTSTPEILLAGEDSQWRTMALAGTVPFSEQVRWGDKNIQEQRYVATYITRQLEQFTTDFTEQGPYTARAGHLAHLRSDFHFCLTDTRRVGELLQALHPTPAVCGLPKQEAFQFIQRYEHHQRSYYSGFMGPLFVEGHTNLFVTLRCMQLFHRAFRLYAGGGLLKDSQEELEWQETETKLDTMRNIIHHV